MVICDSLGKRRQEILCKICASLHRVQNLCKPKTLAGICAKVVQTLAAFRSDPGVPGGVAKGFKESPLMLPAAR
jgi:hypothetical protein